MPSALQTFLQQCAYFLPQLVAGLIVMAATLIIAWLCRAMLRRLGRRVGGSKGQVAQVGASAAFTVINVIGAITALGSMGVNVSALVAGLGLTGFALGFALRDLLSNFLAGLMILVYQPFKLGSVVNVTGFEGRVTEINLRYTVLASEGKTHLVPNSSLLTNVIIISTPKP